MSDLEEDKVSEGEDDHVLEASVSRRGRKRKGTDSPAVRRKRCPYGCRKLLAARTLEYHRNSGCPTLEEEPLGDSDRKRHFCCGVCYQDFVTRTALFEHLSRDHDIQARIHRLAFQDKALFDRFLHWLEKEGGAHFRIKSGSRTSSAGKGIFMGCNRSGSICDLKRIPSFRADFTCTAFINGNRYPDGTISIEFCGDHYGHDARMRLPAIVKQLIAQKQLDGETSPDIIRYLKRQFGHLADSSFLAKRICAVDVEELRTLMVSSTRKWESTGIPNECEIWEEELLDAAGITREGVARLRMQDEKTSDQLAEQHNWPHPHIFPVDVKVPRAFILPDPKSQSTALRPDLISLAKTVKEEEESFEQECIVVTDIKTEEPIYQEKEATVDVESAESGAEEHEASDENDPIIDVSTPSPNELMRRLFATRIAQPLDRRVVLKNMKEDLVALQKMVICNSDKVSGACLVAFQTRIRALHSSYETTISAASRENAAPTETSDDEESQYDPVRQKEGKTDGYMKLTLIDDSMMATFISNDRFKKDLWG